MHLRLAGKREITCFYCSNWGHKTLKQQQRRRQQQQQQQNLLKLRKIFYFFITVHRIHKLKINSFFRLMEFPESIENIRKTLELIAIPFIPSFVSFFVSIFISFYFNFHRFWWENVINLISIYINQRRKKNEINRKICSFGCLWTPIKLTGFISIASTHRSSFQSIQTEK